MNLKRRVLVSLAFVAATATFLFADSLVEGTTAAANHNWRVTLAVSSRTVGAGESIRLTAQANNAIASSPYYLYIEVDGTDVKQCNTSRCETTITYPSAGAHSARAYIYGQTDEQYCYYYSSSSSSSSSSGYCVDVPSGLIAESQSFDLTWTAATVDWVVQLSGPVGDLLTGEPARLIANVNEPLDETPYFLIIENSDTGEVLKSCGNGQSCSTAASRSTSGDATFVAYLSEVADGTGGFVFSDPLTVTWVEVSAIPSAAASVSPQGNLPTFKAQGTPESGPNFWVVFAILFLGTVIVGALLYWAFRSAPRGE